MLTVDVIGRATEAAAVEAALDMTPGAVVLPGEAGIGKTTLWLAGIDAAAARGLPGAVLAGPSEAEARFAFAGLADLLGGAGDVVLAAAADPAAGARGRIAARGVGDPRR